MKAPKKRTAVRKKATVRKKKTTAKKTTKKTKNKSVQENSTLLYGNRNTISRKKLLAELVTIEKEGQLYNQILHDSRLKKEPEIVKTTKEALKLLGKRQHEIFKLLGI